MLRYPHSQMAEKVLKNGGMHRRISMETYMVRVYTGPLSQEMEFVSVEAEKETSAHRIVLSAAEKLRILYPQQYELGEVFCSSGQLCKERRIQPTEHPVRIQLLWPKHIVQNMDKQTTEYRFYLRKKDTELITEPNPIDSFLTLFQSRSNKEYPDLCNLPELNEKTLLANLKSRFKDENIYTYVGSILIAVNPFKFFPIYNPKFVKNYQNRRLGELPPHIFAIADAAFNSMLREKRNQCIVISGESGSGKTESTNLLLHHLTAISQKGLHGSGVEQTILGAGPVLEAFGNAKTVHNNNSSRFGKFIQVNYRENGMVHGAIVEKYLLEKSRIVFQAPNERNYHVFYYLLAGASEQEKTTFHLTEPQDFTYLKQSNCYTLEGVDGEFVDEAHEFERLKQSMEMVGFSTETQRRLFSVLSAVLHIGNVQFKKKSDHYHHEAVDIKNEEILAVISSLLKVKEATLKEALTKKKTVAGGETLLISYKMEEAISTRDAMAKCLYGALFDWIVLQVNHALISKKDSREHQGCSIGVLDIFGFEDFAKNSFEQFCINYANEHLQFYFNQHIFKFEQEEYIKEGIQWKSIEFLDNTSCLKLFSIGLFPLIDEACKLGATTNQDLLDNFHKMHKNSPDYEAPSVKESAFTIVHYAGRVKYRIQDFKEKNMDLMRDDIVMVLKNSSLAFVRELVGVDPVAILRWAIVRAFFRCYFAFVDAGKRYRETKGKSGHGQAAKKSTWLRPQENVQVAEDGTLSPESENLSKEGGIRLDGNRPNITSHEDGSPSSPQDSRMTPKPIDGYQNQGNKENMIRNEIAKLTKMKLKNKSFKPKTRPHKGRRDLKSLKSVAGRQFSMKQGSSVGSQFQSSLTLLMQTLDQANPFFIRCIKSNADKTPCVFDEEIILRQLRYTGMLATVEIRRLGYNYRLAFDEFIHHYKILLPNGLLSSKQDVSAFLSKNITTDDYQIGATKVFLREPEKMELDQALHHAIMERVIKIQRWMRTTLERKKYVQMKKASVMIQSHVRTFIARRRLYRKLFVAISIQKWYRGFKIRRNYLRMVKATIVIQKHYRGYTARQRFKVLLAQDREQRRLKLEEEKEKEKQPQPSVSHLKQDLGDVHSSTSDEGMFTKESSTEELEIDKDFESTHTNDSEESSGILDDSESEAGKHLPPFSTPPLTPVSPKAPPSILTSTVKMRPAISASGEAIGEESLASPVWRPRVRQMVDSIEKPDVSEKHKVPRVTVDSPPKVRRQSAYAKSSGLEPLDLFKQDVVDKRALQNYVTARPLSATIERGPLLSPNSYQAAKRFLSLSGSFRRKKSQSITCSESVSEELLRAGIIAPPASPSLASRRSTVLAPPRRKKMQFKSHSTENRNDDILPRDVSLPNPDEVRGPAVMDAYPPNSIRPLNRPPLAKQESVSDSVFDDTDVAPPRIRKKKPYHSNQEDTFRDEVDFSVPSPDELRRRSLMATFPPQAPVRAPLAKQESFSDLMFLDVRLPLRPKKPSIIKSFSDGSMIVAQQSPSIRVSCPAPLAKQESISDDWGDDDVEEEDRAKTRTLPITKNSKFAAELANDLQKRKTLSPKPKPTESGHKQGGFAKKIKDIVGDIADTKATAARSSLVKHLSVRCKKLSDKLHHGETYHWKKARDDDEYQMEEGLKKTFIDSIGVHVLPNKPGNKISSPTKTPEIEKELLPPEDSEKRKLRRGRRNSRHRREDVKVEPPSTYVVTGRSQWQYPSDLYVKDQRELKDLDQFIFSKLVRMSEDCGQNDSMTERIFKKALKEFHSTLIGSQSLAMKDSNNYKLRYRDLMLSFEQILHCKIEAEDTANNAIEFPSTMVINAFRGFLDEFEKKQRDQGERRAPDKKRNDKKGKKEKDKVIWEHLGHKFMLQQFNIPTFCEYCNSLTWWRDKIYNCQTCKFTCHPKCVSKCTTLCRGQSEEHGSSSSGKVFGAPLSHLILDGMTIPTIFDDMINAIEANGLYTEGLYRKSGVQGKVRQLVKACNENYEIIDFNEYPVHVLATTFKTFLRELPEPLLTFDLFDEFLRGAEISTERERIQSIYSVIEKLPRYNHDMLERLMFHLARVARSEDVNKMSSNGLAIIFAPCILKTNRDLSAQEILSNVPKQTLCVECIILEQLKKLNVTLENISELEDEAASFQIRLESIRDSRKSSKGSRSPGSPQHTLRRVATEVDEENFQMIYREVEREIEGELQSLERKREELTSSLAMLECRNASSDEDMLSAEDIDDDDYATSDYQDAFESPVTPSMNEPAFPITPRFGHNTKDNNGNSHNIETSRRTNSEPSQPRAPLPRFGGFDPSQETPKSRFQKSSSLDQKDNTEQPQTRSQLKLNTVSKDSPKNEASPNDNSPDAAQSKFRFPKFGKAKENKEEVTPKIKLPKFGVSSRDTRDDSSVDVKSKGDFQHSGKFRLRRIGNPKKFRHSFSNDESREQEVTESDTGSSITMSTDSIRSDENYYVQMETGEDDIDEIMV
ncbi:unconventional myosin-IXAa-like isoform X6 [Lineus longissimus]|uniref:unconventional myosin-IXAa-like isoform X6 n=1 Tax=Lineus longissimus TaxID=88925 RepID=UPI00315D1346